MVLMKEKKEPEMCMVLNLGHSGRNRLSPPPQKREKRVLGGVHLGSSVG